MFRAHSQTVELYHFYLHKYAFLMLFEIKTLWEVTLIKENVMQACQKLTKGVLIQLKISVFNYYIYIYIYILSLLGTFIFHSVSGKWRSGIVVFPMMHRCKSTSPSVKNGAVMKGSENYQITQVCLLYLICFNCIWYTAFSCTRY